MVKKLALALVLAAAPFATVQAESLTAGHAKTTAVAGWYANIYYTPIEEAYEVVITIAPGPDQAGRPLRFVSRLAEGQSQEFSIGSYGDNTALTTLTVTRVSDRVSFHVDTGNVSWREKNAAGPAG
jgi:hypothetical protein